MSGLLVDGEVYEAACPGCGGRATWVGEAKWYAAVDGEDVADVQPRTELTVLCDCNQEG